MYAARPNNLASATHSRAIRAPLQVSRSILRERAVAPTLHSDPMLLPPKVKRRRGPVPLHPFDAEHGTDTGALIPGEDLQTGHRHDRYITAYHGTAPSLFAKVMAHWRTVAIHPVEQTAFVDIGAGKGRAMLLASQMPFRRIVGVELHPMLAANLRENVDRWQQTRITPPIRIHEADAMTLRMPAGPCCLFLFNPFDLVLMDRFLERLTKQFAGREQDLDLIYINDEQKRLIAEEHPRLHLLWHGRVFLSHADRDADKTTIRHCADGLYVTSGYEDCSIYRLQAAGKPGAAKK